MTHLDLSRRFRRWFYERQAQAHVRRWSHFSAQATSVPHFLILLFVQNQHGASQADIVDRLMQTGRYAMCENCLPAVSRNLREMEKNGEIELRNGGYYPRERVRFIIKQEDPWYSWFFLISAGLAVAFLILSFWFPTIDVHQVAVALLFVIFIRVIDDLLHTSPY